MIQVDAIIAVIGDVVVREVGGVRIIQADAIIVIRYIVIRDIAVFYIIQIYSRTSITGCILHCESRYVHGTVGHVKYVVIALICFHCAISRTIF